MLVLLLTAALAWDTVAPGVQSQVWTAGGPNRVSAIKVDLCQSGVRIGATASAARGKKTSAWASSVGAKAAINGGFFKSGYKPDGAAAGGGALWPDAVDIPARGWVGFAPHQLRHAASGGVDWPPPPGFVEVVNGDATLVSGGVAVNCGGCGGGRAPRSAVGWTADQRTLYLVGVDGRSSSSVGMSIDELAGLMASLGVDRAMNLDGGGSTTVWSSTGGVLNRPSDGSERTVANHLGVFSGGGGPAVQCPTGWSARYEGSTFPGGARLAAEVGAVLTGSLRFVNDGSFAWDTTRTKLAPLPRDQASPLKASDWDAGHRITTVDADTPPGAVGSFSFSVRIPDTPGTTVQQIALVQEGVSWFGDSWGPADGTFYLTIDALPRPDWRAEWLGGLPDAPWTATPGERIAGELRLRNTGAKTWPAGVVRLATTDPRDRDSALHDPSWVGPNRVASNPADVPPGGETALAVTFRAPDAEGAYEERFGLVAEGITWFADAGGPADDALVVRLLVAPGDTSTPDDTGGGDTDDTEDSEDSARADDTGGPTVIPGGCGCGGAPRGGAWVVGVALLTLGRRRR